MRRIITFTLLALTLTSGVALADRDHRRGGRDRDRSHQRVRDYSHRSGGTVVRDSRVRDNRDYRYRGDRGRRVRVDRRPVYVNNGRYVFHGGISRTYRRPVIRHRYFDYRYRPQILVENYDPVPGYLWVQGSWNWNGREWLWTSGYWAVDPNYSYNYYDSSTGQYYNSY